MEWKKVKVDDELTQGLNILKFTRQPGGQSDIVWSYTGLQI